MTAIVRALSESELEQALAASPRPVAAAFVKEGFAPSDELVSALAAVAPQLAGRMDVVRLDIDRCPRLVEAQRIQRVPELLVWAAGGARLIARTEGAMRESEALGLLEHALTRG